MPFLKARCKRAPYKKGLCKEVLSSTALPPKVLDMKALRSRALDVVLGRPVPHRRKRMAPRKTFPPLRPGGTPRRNCRR
jgi:hypothetical protein